MSRALIPVLLCVFLDLIGFGIVIPLLTYYAEDYEATAVHVTLLMAIYSLAQFLFAPIWGSLSDRYGRRPILIASIGFTALFLAGFAAADELWMLFVFRGLHGACAANVSTAQAAVADLTPPDKRAIGMGLIGAAFGIGFTLGPFIGGETAAYGYDVPIWIASGLSAINFVLALALLPETRHADSTTRPRPITPAAFLRVAQHPVVGLCVVLTFVLTMAFAIMESSFTLFAEHVRGLEAWEVGRMFGVAGLVMIFVQGGMIRPLVKRFGEAPLVPVGVAILAVGLALLPFAPPFGPMVTVFILMAIGQGISSPALSALISNGAGDDEQGFVLGTNQSMSALARAIGPTLAGIFYADIDPAAPFLISSGVLVLGFFLALAAIRQRTRNARTSSAA
ncbi:MAG: MFS transporter [Myxococcota bacterium]